MSLFGVCHATRRHTVGSVRIAELDHEPVVRTRDESAGGYARVATARREKLGRKGACEAKFWRDIEGGYARVQVVRCRLLRGLESASKLNDYVCMKSLLASLTVTHR